MTTNRTLTSALTAALCSADPVLLQELQAQLDEYRRKFLSRGVRVPLLKRILDAVDEAGPDYVPELSVEEREGL